MLNSAKWNELAETIRKKFNLSIFTSPHTQTNLTVAKFAIQLFSAMDACVCLCFIQIVRIRK